MNKHAWNGFGGIQIFPKQEEEFCFGSILRQLLLELSKNSPLVSEGISAIVGQRELTIQWLTLLTR